MDDGRGDQTWAYMAGVSLGPQGHVTGVTGQAGDEEAEDSEDSEGGVGARALVTAHLQSRAGCGAAASETELLSRRPLASVRGWPRSVYTLSHWAGPLAPALPG